MFKNSNLHNAKRLKNDEFFTLYEDIEKEMVHYKDHFKGKTVYCNCDDARESNFFKFFSLNFEKLGLKKLITTGYKADGQGVVLIYEGDKNGNRNPDTEEITIRPLQGNGDFRSEECIEFLKEADIVVTNPPFSLFREYIAQLMEYGKKFIIIGSQNAITYKEVFPFIKNNELWLGMNYVKEFRQPNGEIKKFGNICWFTNLEHNKRHRPIDLYKHYSNEYKHYDNYDAIEISKTCEIPMDYDGVMGVPITFLDKYCPEQFEIVDAREYGLTDRQKNKSTYLIKDADGSIDGKATYVRIAIRHRKAQLMEYGKKFIIMGNGNAITYKDFFPYIKNNEIWLGYTLFVGKMPYFQVPLDTDISKGNYYYENGKLFKQVNSICWFTNLDHNKRHRPLDLYKHYSNEYKHYDNYDAIEVSKVCDIPMDYDGVMGVPITFLDKYCPEQFEILGIANSARYIGDFPCYTIIDGVKIYNRILIRHRK